MIKTIKLTIMGVLAAVLFTGCYEQVPAGTKGKIMGKTGFQPELYPPSKIWVSKAFPFGLNTVSEKLYTVQTTTKKYTQPVQVKLSEEKLNVNVDIIFRGRIAGSDQVLNSIFNDLEMNDNVVTVDEVYEVYGKQVVMNTARSIISQYNVDELPKNQSRITAELYNQVKENLKGSPIEISDVTIGQIDYPEVVEKSIEIATQRRMAIEKEAAEVQIRLTKIKGQEEVAKGQYKIKMIEAKRIRDYNAMTAKGITKDLLELRKLELRELELSKWDGKLPTTLMGANTPVIVNQK